MRSVLSKNVESCAGAPAASSQRLSDPSCLAKSLIEPSCRNESTKPRSGFKPTVSDNEGLRKFPSTRQTEPETLFANNFAVTAQSQLQPMFASIATNRTTLGAA